MDQDNHDKNRPTQTKAKIAYRTRGVTKKTLGSESDPVRDDLFLLLRTGFSVLHLKGLNALAGSHRKTSVFFEIAPERAYFHSFFRTQNYDKIVAGKTLSGAEPKTLSMAEP